MLLAVDHQSEPVDRAVVGKREDEADFHRRVPVFMECLADLDLGDLAGDFGIDREVLDPIFEDRNGAGSGNRDVRVRPWRDDDRSGRGRAAGSLTLMLISTPWARAFDVRRVKARRLKRIRRNMVWLSVVIR